MNNHLTKKHVHGLMSIALSLGTVDPVTSAHLQNLGLVYRSNGQIKTTLKGTTLVQNLTDAATLSLVGTVQ